jgi:hypothetical protein
MKTPFDIKIKGWLFLLAFAATFYWLTNLFTYASVDNFCRISVEGNVVEGNRSAVLDAIAYLRQHDRPAYKLVCRNISMVSERRCLAYDSRVEQLDYPDWISGCYLKGSRIAYIEPSRSTSPEAIAKRAAEIKAAAELSRTFWSQVRK